MMSLVYVEQAYRALEQARSVEDVKDVRDKAESVAQYMKLQGYGREILNAASELKLRAERRLGELLRETSGHSGGSPLHRERDLPPGVSHVQSHRWQLAAEVPADAFESYIAKTKDAGQPITSAAVLRMAKTIRRLRKDRADLHQRMLGGDLSAHAAMVEAGFCRQPTALETLVKAWGKASEDERRRFAVRVAEYLVTGSQRPAASPSPAPPKRRRRVRRATAASVRRSRDRSSREAPDALTAAEMGSLNHWLMTRDDPAAYDLLPELSSLVGECLAESRAKGLRRKSWYRVVQRSILHRTAQRAGGQP